MAPRESLTSLSASLRRSIVANCENPDRVRCYPTFGEAWGWRADLVDDRGELVERADGPDPDTALRSLQKKVSAGPDPKPCPACRGERFVFDLGGLVICPECDGEGIKRAST
jgi:hypothetical protein